MDTIERIFALLEERNISAAQLSRKADINPALLTQWKQRKQKPSTEALIKISKYFDVSVDYLLGNTDEKNKPGEILDERTIRLNELMKKLSPDDIDQVLDYVRFLSEKYKDKK